MMFLPRKKICVKDNNVCIKGEDICIKNDHMYIKEKDNICIKRRDHICIKNDHKITHHPHLILDWGYSPPVSMELTFFRDTVE